MNSLLTKYLPIFSFLAYVNKAYSSSNLLSLSGREYIFTFNGLDGQPLVIGAAFWFVLSILLVYLGWFIVKRIYSRHITGENNKPDEENYSSPVSSPIA